MRKVELKIVARDESGNITRPTASEQLSAILRAGWEAFGNMGEAEQTKVMSGLVEMLQGNPKLARALGLAVSARAAPAAAQSWPAVEYQKITFGPDGQPEGRLILRGNTLEDVGNLGLVTTVAEDGESVNFGVKFTV
jgi:hypothetical protein